MEKCNPAGLAKWIHTPTQLVWSQRVSARRRVELVPEHAVVAPISHAICAVIHKLNKDQRERHHGS